MNLQDGNIEVTKTRSGTGYIEWKLTAWVGGGVQSRCVMGVRSERQQDVCFLFCSGIGAVTCNMTFLPTVVASLVSSGFGTVSGDVTDFSAVEATTVLSTGSVNDLSVFAFQTLVRALTSNVTCLSTVVTCLWTTCTTRAVLRRGSSLLLWFVCPSSVRHTCSAAYYLFLLLLGRA